MNQFKRDEMEFEGYLAALNNDGRAGCLFVYTESVLHFFFGSDFEVLDRVNPLAAFWNGILGALQCSGFMALGRMFDKDNSAHTIHALPTSTVSRRMDALREWLCAGVGITADHRRGVLRQTPAHGTNTWEHLHVARDTAELVAWLKEAPIPEDPRVHEWAAKLKAFI